MRVLLAIPIAFVLLVSALVGQGQDEDSLVSVVDHRWARIRLAEQKVGNEPAAPARMMIPENKYYQRTAREQQSKGAIDPNEYTVDGRSAALEKSVQESRSAKIGDANGFRYQASIKNTSNRKIEIVFWEYRFKEFANPANVVRRQFLCSVKIKPDEKFELWALSTLGPSDVISAASLTDSSGKLFDESVSINRIEYSDGAILQRRDWKMKEIEAELKKATSTPWGREVCRPL